MIRSAYSFHAAIGKLDDVISRVKEIGWADAALCDRMSTFGFNRFRKLCESNGIKPIFGVELPCVAAFGEKKPIEDFWSFLATDNLRSLHNLIWQASLNNERRPNLSYAQALEISAAEGLIAVAGPRLQVGVLPPHSARFYGSLSPSTAPGLLRRMIAAGLPLAARSDNVYCRAEDRELYRIALGWRAEAQTYPQYILSDHDLMDFLKDGDVDQTIIDNAFDNRDSIFNSCNVTMKKGALLKPERPASLFEMCQEGAKKRNVDLTSKEYADRLQKELGIISEKNFEDYFYILADIVGYARSKMVVGPARGSSGGSLVCYLLGITSINPIKYNLIFERFIDINRSDYPDIDVDFVDEKRDLIFEYAKTKFGRERVARLGTVGMLQAKSALNVTGAALKIPKWETDKIADSLIVYQQGDARYGHSLEDTFNETDAGRKLVAAQPEIRIAQKLEGMPQNPGQHAAGLLLTADPVAEFVAVNAISSAAFCDMKDAEELNLLKLDALGLTQLAIFDRTMELIGVKSNSEWLENIPLEDPEAFKILNDNKFSGIFQFTGQAVKGLTQRVKVDKLDDLVALTSIARPGAMDSGGAEEWIKRRNGVPVPPRHPVFDEITKDTYGILIYQEQVMQICRGVSGFNWPDTIAVRKLIGKKQGPEALKSWEDRFCVGAYETVKMPVEEAKQLWSEIVTFGRYGFVKAHAVAYSTVSYWCCWLKAHHPLAFGAATLDREPDSQKQLQMLRELATEGITYKAVDVDKSTDRWTYEGDKLLGPLSAIRNIGPAKVREILNNRAIGEPMKPGIQKALEKCKTDIDSLYPIKDRVSHLHPDLNAIGISGSYPIVDVNDIQPGFNGDFITFVRINRITPKNENAKDMVEKRGHEVQGNAKAINLFVADDTDEIFAKIDRDMFIREVDPLIMFLPEGLIGPSFLETAKAGDSLFAMRGFCPRGFRMISIKTIKYLGEMKDA